MTTDRPNINRLISEDYLRQQTELHTNPDYGVSSLYFAPIVANIVQALKIGSVTDYGAGKKNLLRGLNKAGVSNVEYYPYDPVFPEYGLPRPAQLVCCIDVLEHIEPEYIDNVLAELHGLTMGYGFFTVHTQPAMKVLPDGRNAHLTQAPSSWWLKKLTDYFEVLELRTIEGRWGFWILVERRQAV